MPLPEVIEVTEVRVAKSKWCCSLRRAGMVLMGGVLCAGHFDVYLGSTFEEVAGEQARFFVETFEHPVPVVEATEAMPLL